MWCYSHTVYPAFDSPAIEGKYDQRMLWSVVAQIDPRLRSSHKTFFFKPIDSRRYIRLAKALIRLLICRLRVCRLIRLFVQVIIGFTMHRPMSDLFLQTITLNILGKVFNRHFEIFLSFFQENRICISCKLSPLHEMSNPVFLVIKQITIFFFIFIYLFIFFCRLLN